MNKLLLLIPHIRQQEFDRCRDRVKMAIAEDSYELVNCLTREISSENLFDDFWYLLRAKEELIDPSNEINDAILNCEHWLRCISSQKIRESAEFFRVKGDLELIKTNSFTAIKCYEKSLAKEDNYKTRKKAVEICLKTDQIDKGVNLLEKIKNSNAQVSILLHIIEDCLEKDNYWEAGILWEKVVIIAQLPDYFPQLLRAYNLSQRYQLVIEKANEFLEVPNVEKNIILWELGIAFSKTKKYAEATVTFSKIDIQKLNKTNTLALYQRWAIALRETNNIAAAQEKIMKVIAFFPDDKALNLMLGEILYSKNNYEQALEQYQKLDSNDWDVLHGLAFCYLQTGHYAKSFEVMNRLLDGFAKTNNLRLNSLVGMRISSREIRNNKGERIETFNLSSDDYKIEFARYLVLLLQKIYENIYFQLDLSPFLASLTVYKDYIGSTVDIVLYHSLENIKVNKIEENNQYLLFLKQVFGKANIGRSSLYFLENALNYLKTNDDLYLSYLSQEDRDYIQSLKA